MKENKIDLFKRYLPEDFIDLINRRMDSDFLSATCEKITFDSIKKSVDKLCIKDYSLIQSFHGTITHKTKFISTLYKDAKFNTYGVFIGNISDEKIEIKSFRCILDGVIFFEIQSFVLHENVWMDYPHQNLNSEKILGSELIFIINDKIFANYVFDSDLKVSNFFSKNIKFYG